MCLCRCPQLHDVDNLGILKPVTKATLAPASVADIPNVILKAVALATTGPLGPVAVEIPSDMLSATHRLSHRDDLL